MVTPSTFSYLLFLRVSFPHTRLVWSSWSTSNNIKEHLSVLRTMELLKNHFDQIVKSWLRDFRFEILLSDVYKILLSA